MDGDFSGHVYEGYLRKDDPTGEKVNFNNGAIASYDFSSDLRNFQGSTIRSRLESIQAFKSIC